MINGLQNYSHPKINRHNMTTSSFERSSGVLIHNHGQNLVVLGYEIRICISLRLETERLGHVQ